MGKNKEEWAIARERTGRCETCGSPMRGHPRCKACGILTGLGHQYNLVTFRGCKICGGCAVRWLKLERKLERAISWEELLAENWREMYGKPVNEKPGQADRLRASPAGQSKKEGIDPVITDSVGQLVARRASRQHIGGNVKQRSERCYSL